MICLHCGNEKPYSHKGYCEDCFQDIITENAKLQLKIKELEKQLQIKHPKHMKE